MRREVESLLGYVTDAERFIGAPALEVAAKMMTGDHAELPVGRQIGAYKILFLLGAGGMGEVYRARDMKLGRDVAIKVLPAAFTSDSERLARFEPPFNRQYFLAMFLLPSAINLKICLPKVCNALIGSL